MSKETLAVGDVELPDWRWILEALRAQFHTGDFAAGAQFVAGIAAIADEMNHHPDVDLRYGHVSVVTTSHDAGGVTERDVELARRISVLADESSFEARPDLVQRLELALDTPNGEAVAPFWAAVLGLALDDSGDVTDPSGALPPLWFQETTSERPDRMRFHLDISVPPEQAQRRIAAALKAGGRLVDTSNEPSWTILEDVDGNKVCVCTALARD